jgi:hypothetical protein
MSTKPGASTNPVASITLAPSASGPIAAIRPSWTDTSAR